MIMIVETKEFQVGKKESVFFKITSKKKLLDLGAIDIVGEILKTFDSDKNPENGVGDADLDIIHNLISEAAYDCFRLDDSDKSEEILAIAANIFGSNKVRYVSGYISAYRVQHQDQSREEEIPFLEFVDKVLPLELGTDITDTNLRNDNLSAIGVFNLSLQNVTRFEDITDFQTNLSD